MNPRIQELVEEAGLDAILDQHAHEYGNGMLVNTSYPEVAKFAELIIKETLEVARAGVEFGNGMEDAVYNYFGVNE